MIATFWDGFDPAFFGGLAVIIVVAMFGLLWRKIDKHVVEPVREIPVIRATQVNTAADIGLIKAELFPNHGSSLRDSVNRNEVITADTAAAVATLDAKVEDHIASDTAIWDKIDASLEGIKVEQGKAATTATRRAKGG